MWHDHCLIRCTVSQELEEKVGTLHRVYVRIRQGLCSHSPLVLVLVRSLAEVFHCRRQTLPLHGHSVRSSVDGDNDAAWTESTTVVMDDNKVLILVSNERIPLTPTMCMLLVSQDMKHTSPATFSHGVVLSINESTSCRKSSMRKFERQARDRASCPRPSRRVLRGPRRRSRLSVSAHAPWRSCVRGRMCPLLHPAGVETVVSEIDIIVSSTGSFNVISFDCFHWKHRTL